MIKRFLHSLFGHTGIPYLLNGEYFCGKCKGRIK
ncbi:hypothetical protein LCGC14_1144240 [marine sediment metagenome]|uniref:Uncharacterized protein n=1 Tax=marine sediment metagenome TaxID=412755 RepID=A0A0F9Q356_9ZZZZ